MTGRLNDEVADVRALLHEQWSDDVADLCTLPGGVFTRTFGFRTDGKDYVVRLSTYGHAAEAFAKDAYAGRHFGSSALPIPRVLATGRRGDETFAISERVAGRRLAEWPAATRRALLPTTLDTFDAIARADLDATRGYGSWGADGNGREARWHDVLAAAIENHAGGFYQDWHALFVTSFLERDVYERVYRYMLGLAARCPEERALLHCDYHFDNVLSDGAHITGVIDWGNACYGDPLYDVAWLGGWFAKEGDHAAVQALHERHRGAPHFRERIACYTCHIGLDDLRFYARTGQLGQYIQTRDRLLRLLAGNPDPTE
ncbi:MAG: aminoglycoside phosphotransferase family protein [Chloroflexi bacterium]|nr:aminoglycoside phosphotransferase family protein [Chloroflexota bacterium]